MASLSAVVRQLRQERGRAAKELGQLDAALAALDGAGRGKRTGTRSRMSAAGRARIAAAQRARWAKLKANGRKNVVTMPKKRAMSAAARKRIAAAQKARWAKIKATEKKSG